MMALILKVGEDAATTVEGSDNGHISPPRNMASRSLEMALRLITRVRPPEFASCLEANVRAAVHWERVGKYDSASLLLSAHLL